MTLAEAAWSAPPERSPARRAFAPSQPPVLIVPGINGSGPEHWQTHWQRILPNAERVEQFEWAHPRLADWVAGLAEAVRGRPGALLVAHSLGCALVAHWAGITGGRGVAGALLVAPADVECDSPPCRKLSEFAPMPMAPLAFPSLVAASRNDPYVSLQRAEGFAKAWRSTFVDVGAQGHINVASGHGPWLEGLSLLDPLLERITQRLAS